MSSGRQGSAGALKVDQVARTIFNRAALAAGMNDAEQALAVCRDLGEVESTYELRFKGSNTPTQEHAGSFSGLPIASKYPGRCAVCGEAFPAGAAILYDRESRKAAHERCGEIIE